MEERRLEIKINYVRDGVARVERFSPGTSVGEVCRRIGVRPGVRFWWIDQGRYLQTSECQPVYVLEPGIYKCDTDCDDEQPAACEEPLDERWSPARVVALQQRARDTPSKPFDRPTGGSANGVLIIIVGVAVVLLLVVTLILLV